MHKNRRKFIQQFFSLSTTILVLGNSLFYSALSHAKWQKENFSADNYANTIARLFKQKKLIKTKKIKFNNLPKISENGSSVPLTISSSLQNVTKISVLVKQNPSPLTAEFYLSPAVEPRVSVRLKLAKSSDVVVVVETKEKFYYEQQWVKVTIGGCG